MSAESGMNEILKEETLDDVLPTNDRELKKLAIYISNAKPNDEFTMNARTLKSLLNRINQAENKRS